MRILYARNLFRPLDLGGNRYPLEVTTRLSRRGHDVIVVTGRFAGAAGVSGLRLVQYPMSRHNPLLTFGTNAFSSRLAIARVISRWRPDVVLLGSYDVGYGWCVRRPTDGPCVFFYHSSFHSEAVRRLASGPPLAQIVHPVVRRFVRHVERAVLRSADHIVAVSSFSAREIAERTGRANLRIEVIPTGVDIGRFSPGDQAEARRRIGLDIDDFVLVTVGRLVPLKRYDRAVRAVAGLRRVGLSSTLLVVGDGPEREPLSRLAADLGLGDRIRFEGFKDGPALVDRLRAADLQLCTSEYENWSLSLLEGLACSLPVLGVPSGGTPELLTPVDPTLVLPDGEVESLVLRIAELAADRSRLRGLARRARLHAERFTWDAIVERLENALLVITGNR